MTEQEKGISNDFDSIAEVKTKELTELVEMGLFAPGDRYGVEQFFDDPEQWTELSDQDRKDLLKSLGKRLGVDISNYPKEEIVRRYHEEGVPGELSEKGAEVEVLKTKDPQFEVHVMRYVNPDLGTRYDLVAVTEE